VVADGDDIARFTCLDMFFRSFLDLALVESLQIYILSTPDVLLVYVLGTLDLYFSFPTVLLGSSLWYLVTLRRFCNPSSGG
jgi:hypothetical protein